MGWLPSSPLHSTRDALCPFQTADQQARAVLFRARERAERRSFRLCRLEGRTKTQYQMLLIERLRKVTNDPIFPGAGVVDVVGIGS